MKIFWLTFFSKIYRMALFFWYAAFRLKFIRVKKLGVPVFSIGNLSVGGTGKTPAVASVVGILRAQNKKPGILSRGYGRKKKGDLIVTVKERSIPWEEAGDEPAMLFQKLFCAMGIGENRYRVGQALLSNSAVDCLVLDDGFQHRKLYRNANILIIDALRPPWQDDLLPKGQLREPVSAMNRADAFILVTSYRHSFEEIKNTLKEKYPAKPCFFASVEVESWIDFITGRRIPFESLKGKTVGAFACIANPHRFEETLKKAGLFPCISKWFRDHYPIEAHEFNAMMAEFNHAGADFVVTTEKDAIRLRGLPIKSGKLVVLLVEMNIIEKKEFTSWLISKF